jgi:hypothetical protein
MNELIPLNGLTGLRLLVVMAACDGIWVTSTRHPALKRGVAEAQGHELSSERSPWRPPTQRCGQVSAQLVQAGMGVRMRVTATQFVLICLLIM